MFAETMMAVRIMEHGGVDVLKYGEYPKPQPADNELLVRVLATSLSSWDLSYRKGAWLNGSMVTPLAGRKMFPLPMQLGRDAVGVVEGAGKNVKRFKLGDKVVGLPHPENSDCYFAKRGLGNLSTNIDLPGHTLFGGHAQYVVREERYWENLPANVHPNDAAAAMWSYATSHRIVADRAEVRLGDTVLITGVTGGMGSAAAELAAATGARIIGLTRSEAKAETLRRAGVEPVILADDVSQSVARIRALTDGRGVDAAIEYTGKAPLLRLCVDSLRLGGTFVPGTADWTTDPMPISALDMIRLELNIRGIRGSRLNDQRIVLQLLAEGRIEPKIHAVMPLSQIAKAHALLESGEVEGRIVLDPSK